ncbi:hypothetical protein D9613_009120 [Agrocybe pediades]|uniref:Carboxylesterase type B domain-containing protein n=1 Tax=Agrocybe pediades TaxID=84607 RepID=A0A8H4R435_9AGAR|nr:hypothetical protein D9613_009120 [Agrocybe pediades]
MASANAADKALFQSMREYWTSFVTSGKPVSKNGVVWQPTTLDSGGPRLLLNPSGIKMEQMAALADRCKLWQGISKEIWT